MNTHVLLVFVLIAVIYTQDAPAPLCTPMAVNSDLSVHLRVPSGPSSAVFLGCANRSYIECKYYIAYRSFVCNAYDSPCGGPRYAVINGQCCDLGSGCPDPLPQTPPPAGPAPEIPQEPEPAPVIAFDPRYGDLENRVTILEGFKTSESQQVANLDTKQSVLQQQIVSIVQQVAQMQQQQQQPQPQQPPQPATGNSNPNQSDAVAKLADRLTALEGIVLEQSSKITKLQEQNLLLTNLYEASKKEIEAFLNKLSAPATAPTTPTVPIIGQPQSSSSAQPVTDFTQAEVIQQQQQQQLQQQQTGITVLSIMIVLGILGIICVLVAVVLYKRRRSRTISLRE